MAVMLQCHACVHFKALKWSIHHRPPPININENIDKNTHPYETYHHMTSFPPQGMIYATRYACNSFFVVATLNIR